MDTIRWIWSTMRENTACILGILAVMCLVPMLLLFTAAYMVDSTTVHRWIRALEESVRK